MSKHTLGPWTVDTDTGGRKPIMAKDGITSVAHTDGLENEDLDEANARLIAAAPEMLQALKRAVSMLQAVGMPADAIPQDLEKMEDAIAKAEGEHNE